MSGYMYSVLWNATIVFSAPIGEVGDKGDYTACVQHMLGVMAEWGIVGVDHHPFYVMQCAKKLADNVSHIDAVKLLIHAYPGLTLSKADHAIKEFAKYKLEITGGFDCAAAVYRVEKMCSGGTTMDYYHEFKKEVFFSEQNKAELKRYARDHSNKIGDTALIAIIDLL